MSPTLYAAPQAPQPLDARVHLPGSKSLTNRALILAALAKGPSTLTGVLRSRDTDLMIEALRAMGVGIEETIPEGHTRATTLRIVPGPLQGAPVYCGLAGTLLRFLPGVAALACGDTILDADEQARQRPLSAGLMALRDLGIPVDSMELPVTITGQGPHPQGGAVHLDASSSSQFISGLMLCGARWRGGLHIVHSGSGPVPSQPHLQMTMAMLQRHGVRVEQPTPTQWKVPSHELTPVDWAIEPDLSNAAPFLAAAAVAGGRVTIADWPIETTQPGDQLPDLFRQMGCTVTFTPTSDEAGDLTLCGPQTLQGVNCTMQDIGELAPTIAAVATCAHTPSRLRGIAHLRGHETNRLQALVTEIHRCGGDAEETDDGLIIRPTPLQSGVWHSYADHRMATAGAIVGLASTGTITVENMETTSKTLPGFADAWTALIADAQTEVWL